MGAAIGKDVGSGQAHERQVADQVQDFMAHRFIAKSQGGLSQ